MATHYEAQIRKPLVTGNKSYHDVSVDVAAPVEGVANKQWWIVFGIALTGFMWGVGNLVTVYAHVVVIIWLIYLVAFGALCAAPIWSIWEGLVLQHLHHFKSCVQMFIKC